MKKRGLNQIDWAISLGIFLIYLAWFFIFLKPQFVKTADLSPLFDIIKENLENDLSWEVYKQPLFSSSSMTKNSTPVFINFTRSNAGNSIFILGSKDYFYFKNKILLLEDFNNDSKYYFLLESNKTYNHTNSRLDITKNGEIITTSKNFKAYFDNGLIENVTYKNNRIIKDIKLYINDNEFPTSSNSYSDQGIIAQYIVDAQPLSLYTHILAKNSVMWFYAQRNDFDTLNDLLIELSLPGFDNYFSDNNNYGKLSNGKCENYYNNQIIFNDSSISVSFMLPNNTDISFCVNSSLVNMNLTIEVDDDKELFIIADNASYDISEFTDYNTFHGLKQTIEGVDLDILSSFDYETKKEEWGYPPQRNFQIIIWNSSLNDFSNRQDPLLELGSEPITIKEVYVGEYREFLLDKKGELSEITVGIKTW